MRFPVGDYRHIRMAVLPRRAGQHLLILLFVCLCGVVVSIPVCGLDRDRTIAQFHHTAWTIKDGAPTPITALAQTKDGYLWIGSWRGLFRFDGVRFERYEPPAGFTLPSPYVFSLMPTPDGGLWISFNPSGVAFLKDGQLHLFTKPGELPRSHVYCFARDLDGQIWAGAHTGLMLFDGQRWREIGTDWNFKNDRIWTMFVDRDGTLWVATDDTIVTLRRGSRVFQTTGLRLRGGAPRVGQAKSGQMLMSELRGTLRPIPVGPDHHIGGPEVQVEAVHFIFDREGSLWMAGERIGLRRLRFLDRERKPRLEVSDPDMESFTQLDGLSEASVGALLEDREGNIWVGTGKGLDRFSQNHFVPVKLPSLRRNLILLAGERGEIWVGSAYRASLLRIRGEEMVAMGPPLEVSSVCRDSQGVGWWGAHGGILRQHDNHFQFFPQPKQMAPDFVWEVTPDDLHGGLWIRFGDAGLMHFKDGRWTNAVTPPGLDKLRPRASYHDSLGRTWFGHDENRVSVLEGAHVQSYSHADGIDIGIIRVIRGNGPQMWFGGDSGLALLDQGRFWTIQTVAGRRFATVTGIVEAPDGALWLNELHGVVRIPPEDVSHVKKKPTHAVHYQTYNFLDGLPGSPQMNYRSSTAIQATDGRLWFATDDGLAWIDPLRISTNSLPPPVSILSLATERKKYPALAPVNLPPRTVSLRIEYTALSLSVPERTRFRNKLEGLDEDWQDAGTRREAVYNNLRPNTYRFRVIASNSDGVWNDEGATLDFIIAPAWYQTTSFRGLCVLIGLFLVSMLYRIRVRQIAKAVSARFDERLAERTRIARELHDTLIQTVQGSKMVADDALDQAPDPDRMRRALEQLSLWLGQATQEGRAALNALRTSTLEQNDLAEAFRRAVDECRTRNSMETSLSVVGEARDTHPVVRDEVYRIGYEAIRNACAHSGGSRLEVGLIYGRDLIVRVRDNGRGMDSMVAEQGKDGHFGLQGMRERARRIGGRLTVTKAGKSGTEITVVVPGRIVFPGEKSARLKKLKDKLTRWR